MKKWLFLLLFSSAAIAYQFGDGEKRLFTETELANTGFRQLQVMKNDIFAAHGHRFSDSDWAAYYESQLWYKAGKDNRKISLSETEQKNVEMIQNRLKWVEENLRKISRQLNEIARVDQAAMEAQLNMKFEEGTWADFQRLLLQINYSALEQTGYSATYADDGELNLGYVAEANGDKITLSFHRNLSRLEPQIKRSENEELAVFWHFKLINGKLAFVKVDIAG